MYMFTFIWWIGLVFLNTNLWHWFSDYCLTAAQAEQQEGRNVFPAEGASAELSYWGGLLRSSSNTLTLVLIPASSHCWWKAPSQGLIGPRTLTESLLPHTTVLLISSPALEAHTHKKTHNLLDFSFLLIFNVRKGLSSCTIEMNREELLVVDLITLPST